MRHTIIVVACLLATGCAGLIGLDDKTKVDATDGVGGASSTAQGGSDTHAGGVVGMGGSAGVGAGVGGHAGMSGGGTHAGGTSGTSGGSGHSGTAGSSGAPAHGGMAGMAGHAGVAGATSSGGKAGFGAGGDAGGIGGQSAGVGGDKGGGGNGGDTGGVGGDMGGIGGDMGGIGGDAGGVGGVGGDMGGAGTTGGGGTTPVTTLVFSYYDSNSALTPAQSDRIYRFDPATGAPPEDLSALLDSQLGPGPDFAVNISHDGTWLVFVTGRGDCSSLNCVAVARNDATLSGATLIKHKTQFSSEFVVTHWFERPAINSAGTVVAYAALDVIDSSEQLFLVTRAAPTGVFTGQTQLTHAADLGHAHNLEPAFTLDDQSLYFECTASDANSPEQYTGRGICTSLFAAGTSADAVKPVDLAGATPAMNGVRHPSQAPSGDLLFEGQPAGEFPLVWHKKTDLSLEILSYQNAAYEAAPCALSDGRVAFLGRSIDAFPQDVGIRLASTDDPTVFETAPQWPMFATGSPDTLTANNWMGCGVTP